MQSGAAIGTRHMAELRYFGGASTWLSEPPEPENTDAAPHLLCGRSAYQLDHGGPEGSIDASGLYIAGATPGSLTVILATEPLLDLDWFT